MSDSAEAPDEALDSFVAKWRARWPEWTIAEVFVPHALRGVAQAWAALQQELTDAAWGGGDPRPGELKLAWWQEELQGWAQGRRRHPLGTALQRLSVQWDVLAAALPVLRDSRERPRDADEAFASLLPVAAAIAAVDTSLFPADRSTSADDDARVIAANLLLVRCLNEGDGHVPLSVLARAGEGEPRAIWAEQLRQRWPTAVAASRVRRIWSGLARARLVHGTGARPLSPWTTLRVSWRAARN